MRSFKITPPGNPISHEDHERDITPLDQSLYSILSRLIPLLDDNDVNLRSAREQYLNLCTNLKKYEEAYQQFTLLENNFQITLNNMSYSLFRSYFIAFINYPTHLQDEEYTKRLQELEAFLYTQKESFESRDTLNGYTFLARLYQHQQKPEKLVELYKDHKEFIPFYENYRHCPEDQCLRDEPCDIFYACLKLGEFDLAASLIKETNNKTNTDEDNFSPLEQLLPRIGKGDLEGFKDYLQTFQMPTDETPMEQLKPYLGKAAFCLFLENNPQGAYEILQELYQQPECIPFIPIPMIYLHSKFEDLTDDVQALKDQVKAKLGYSYEEFQNHFKNEFFLFDFLIEHTVLRGNE